jgi:RNA polymerase sigma-54 factor
MLLSPSLQQAIKLLSLTTRELEDLLELEATLNPLLEKAPVDEASTVEEITQEQAREGRKNHEDLADVFVVKDGESYRVVLNDDGLPKLRISPMYRRMLDEADFEEMRNYVKDKLRSALWLLKTVEQRQKMI